MKERISIILFVFFYSGICFSQQIYYKATPNLLSDYSPTFDSRFGYESMSSFGFDDKTEFYQSKKVKTVEVTSENGVVVWRLRLNEKGNIINIGYSGYGYFTEYEDVNKGKEDLIRITRYYEHDVLVRIDSIKSFTRQYSNEDTIIECQFVDNIDYRMGYLINERNRYYNSNYLGKKVDYSASSYFTILYTMNSDTLNYFDEPFKTNYDSLTMYQCHSYRQVENRNGYFQSTNKGIDFENKSHPFFNKQYKDCFYNYYVDGADFREPSFYRPSWSCNVYPYGYFADNGCQSGYHYSENGLITEYYNDLYEEDTAASRIANVDKEKKRKEFEKTAEARISTYAVGIYDGPIIVRSKVPKRLDTYYYRYEYYNKN